jgi:hypothetical protein
MAGRIGVDIGGAGLGRLRPPSATPRDFRRYRWRLSRRRYGAGD